MAASLADKALEALEHADSLADRERLQVDDRELFLARHVQRAQTFALIACAVQLELIAEQIRNGTIFVQDGGRV